MQPPLQPGEARPARAEHGDLAVQDQRLSPGHPRQGAGDLREAAGGIPAAPPPDDDRPTVDVGDRPGAVPLRLGGPLGLPGGQAPHRKRRRPRSRGGHYG